MHFAQVVEGEIQGVPESRNTGHAVWVSCQSSALLKANLARMRDLCVCGVDNAPVAWRPDTCTLRHGRSVLIVDGKSSPHCT